MLMLPARVKACLANQLFQENDTLRPDWRLVLVHQAIPQTVKDHIVRAYYEAAIDNGDNYEAEFSFLKHNTGKMLRYRGAT